MSPDFTTIELGASSWPEPRDRPRATVLPTLTMVAAIHAAIAWAIVHRENRPESIRPLPVVQVSLVSNLPARKAVTPRPTAAMTQPHTDAARQQQQIQVPEKPAAAMTQASPRTDQARQADNENASDVEPLYRADYLHNPPPAYPLTARRRGDEGTVIIHAQIAADGRCLEAEIKKGSGHELLDRAAQDAVRRWRFVPARHGAQAITAWVDVPITFKLHDE